MRAAIGALFWLALALAAWLEVRGLEPETRASWDRVQVETWRAVLAPSPSYEVRFRGDVYLRPGNGVYLEPGPASPFARVGEVTAVRRDGNEVVATVLLDTGRGDLELQQGTRIVRRTQGASLLFSMRTILPPYRIEAIQGEWEKFQRRYQSLLVQMVQPILPGLIADTLQFLVQEIEQSIRQRQPEIAEILHRYREEVAADKILPLITTDVWPIVAAKGAAPSRAIGRELWNEVPLFGLAWRSVWDSAFSDGPEKLETAFNEFVKDHAVPILRDHRDQIEATLLEILKEVTRSPGVEARVREIADLLVKDRELRELIARMIQDIAASPRLREFLQSRMENEVVKSRLLAANDVLQIFFTEVGNLIFLDETKEAINPDLARLMRVLVLHRDRQYLFLQPGSGEPLQQGEELLGINEG